MKRELQILVIEDNADDVFRITRELRRGGLEFRSKLVESKEDFLKELEQGPPDLVLSDHGLPSFDGFTALDLVQQRCPEVPFIFITGSYDQALMIEMFESGATDYVYKNHLNELVPAVQRALTAERESELAEPELLIEEPEAVIAPPPIDDGLGICSACRKVGNALIGWQPIEEYLQQHSKAMVTRLVLCPDCRGAVA